MTRPHVDKVNVHAVDPCHELRQSIELRFDLSPVVVSSPITHQLLEVCELYALRPVIDRLSVGPSRGGNAPAEVNEVFLGDVNTEGTNSIARDCGGQL